MQAPIREVAYDFSDADFYNRNYAPSPAYEASNVRVAPLRPTARANALRDAPGRAITPPAETAATSQVTPALPAGAAVAVARAGTEPGSVVVQPAGDNIAAKAPARVRLK